MIKNHDIVCISTSNWEKPWTSKQQFMSRLAKNNRVLYVESQISFFHPFRYPFLWKNYLSWFKGLRKIDENLYLYTPFPKMPLEYYNKILNRLNQFLLRRSLIKLIKKLNFKNFILWIYAPSSWSLAKKLKEGITIYHCIDDFSKEKNIVIRQRTIRNYEEILAQRCDLIFTTSNILRKRFEKLNTNTYLIAGAVDNNFFSDISNYNLIEPKDLKFIKRPRIGLVGTIDNRIDFSLIKYLTFHRPEWEIILIGPLISRESKAIRRQLSKQKNIHFLGPKAKEETPRYMNSLDVCLIPYKFNEFTMAISPIKFFEYLALGKPIVSIRLPDLEIYEDNIVRLADNEEDFVRNIALSLEEKEPVKKRIEIARENTWDKRLETISQIIERFI